jgi:anti-sigma regulatory factor (Ser/Thr protein kinase)
MPTRVLPSNADAVPHALAFIESAAAEAGLDTALADRLLLAAGEAVDNAVVHGNRGRNAATVRVTLRFEPAAVEFTVEDEGDGLTAAQFAQAILPADEATGGRGLYLLRTLANEVVAEGPTVRLRFFRATP